MILARVLEEGAVGYWERHSWAGAPGKPANAQNSKLRRGDFEEIISTNPQSGAAYTKEDVEIAKRGRGFDIEPKNPRDYDPEDEPAQEDDDSLTGLEDNGAAVGSRDHYEQVGKSKLREPESVPIDAKYGGVAVRRGALDAHESDDEDPFAEAKEEQSADTEGEEPDSEETEYEDPETGSQISSTSSEDEIDDEEMNTQENEVDQESEEESEEADDGHGPQNGQRTYSSRRAEASALANQASDLVAGLSKAANMDLRKGQAVKKQYQTFDRLLDARMKLQKSLAASNDLDPQRDALFSPEAEEALQTARRAALQLFSTISNFRISIASAQTSDERPHKRKKLHQVQDVADVDSAWEMVKEQEEEALNARRLNIDRWSRRAKQSTPGQAAPLSKSRLLDSSEENRQLTSVLDTFIINEQAKHFDPHDDTNNQADDGFPTYDDGVFYQSLLRDLITSRSVTSSTNLSGSLLPPKLHPSGNKQSRKNVDTKASKGRKIRYTVHEKLQNFMAAEGDTGRDTAMWTERGKDEFFGSLFGQDRALREESDEEMVHGEHDAEAEALRLFRT